MATSGSLYIKTEAGLQHGRLASRRTGFGGDLGPQSPYIVCVSFQDLCMNILYQEHLLPSSWWHGVAGSAFPPDLADRLCPRDL